MKKVVFFDRDGVINQDLGYVHSTENCVFTEKLFEGCQLLQQLGYEFIIVTNQSGIGRGYYSEQVFWDFMDWMKQRFNAFGIHFLGIYFCPHHPEQAVGQYKIECLCRKPKPGMLLQAQQDYNIDMRQSVMIGDSEEDMLAAQSAGVGLKVLIGKKNDSLADWQVNNVYECAQKVRSKR